VVYTFITIIFLFNVTADFVAEQSTVKIVTVRYAISYHIAQLSFCFFTLFSHEDEPKKHHQTMLQQRAAIFETTFGHLWCMIHTHHTRNE